ncbi:MAG: nucleotidyltransferase family protein [Candidatus Omnitrophica bacterium]|nr:nucleotidyltransferase family protein [Candidatus Omnitrophota bacterium]
MKALVLAGGRGKRLGAATEDINKCMIEVCARPLITYSLDLLRNLPEISEILTVVGYRAGDIINCIGNEYAGIPVHYVEQPEQKGLVHAIECARDKIAGDDFMLMLGDELMKLPRHHEFLREYDKSGVFALCGVVKVANRALISKTYSVRQSEKAEILELVEKPGKPFNDLMGTGNCIFNNRIYDYIARTPVNAKRGERELTDLIQVAINDGNTVKSFVICDEYVNVNDPEELRRSHSYFAHL